MRNVLRTIITTPPPPIVPSLKSSCKMFCYSGRRGDVMYGLTNTLTHGNDFASGWTVSGGTITSITNGIIRATGSGTGAAISFIAASTYAAVSGHRMYMKSKARVVGNTCTQIVNRCTPSGNDVSLSGVNTPTADVWYPIFGTGALSTTSGLLDCRVTFVFADAATANGKIVEMDGNFGTMLFDLTTDISAGNEPTAAEMDAILNGIAYWEGTKLVKCNPNGQFYWYDYSGNNRHMKLYNFSGVTTDGWSVGVPALLQSDGIDSWIGRAETNLIPANTSFTVVQMLSPDTDSGLLYGMIGFKTNFTTDYGIRTYYLTDRLVLEVFDSVSGSVSTTYINPTTKGKPYIFISTYDQTDKKLRLFINGVLVLTSSALTNGNSQINYMRFCRSSTGGTYVVQRTGLVGVFQKCFTDLEVKQQYNAICKYYGLPRV